MDLSSAGNGGTDGKVISEMSCTTEALGLKSVATQL